MKYPECKGSGVNWRVYNGFYPGSAVCLTCYGVGQIFRPDVVEEENEDVVEEDTEEYITEPEDRGVW